MLLLRYISPKHICYLLQNSQKNTDMAIESQTPKNTFVYVQTSVCTTADDSFSIQVKSGVCAIQHRLRKYGELL